MNGKELHPWQGTVGDDCTSQAGLRADILCLQVWLHADESCMELSADGRFFRHLRVGSAAKHADSTDAGDRVYAAGAVPEHAWTVGGATHYPLSAVAARALRLRSAGSCSWSEQRRTPLLWTACHSCTVHSAHARASLTD